MLIAPRSGVRLVLDTNTVVSGLFWNGPPAQLLRLARSGIVVLFVSDVLLDELLDVLTRQKFAKVLHDRESSPFEQFISYALLCEFVDKQVIPPTVLRDPDDDAVLAAATAGEVDLIVSGDRDLLDIGAFRSIPIINAAKAVALVNQRQETT